MSDERSLWDRDGIISEPPRSMWLVPSNLGDKTPDWDTTLGSSRPEGFNCETEYIRADQITALAARLEAAEEALRWYANPEVYAPHPHGPAFDRRDLSHVARAALTPPATETPE